MNSIKLLYENSSLVSLDNINKHKVNLLEQIKIIKNSRILKYETEYAVLNLCADQQLINNITELANIINSYEPEVLVIIGIGGSNLGSLAVIQGLYGTYYNELTKKIKVYCADTIDQDYNLALLNIININLNQNKKVILNIISKSGTTTETIINSSLFINLLKKYYTKEELERYIVITTDKDSKLWELAKKENYTKLHIESNIGGRYSVLSAAGLFPLALLGININQLQAGACDISKFCLSENIYENPAALSSIIIFENYLKNINIVDTFLFSPDFENLGKWYRQLLAESLGKSHDKNGNLVETGITPTVSIGTTDLHSVTQLYLAGPRDKFTIFVDIENEPENLLIPENNFAKIITGLENKSVNYIKKSILKAVKQAYIQEKRPFISLLLKDKSAYCLGQFIMLKICEVIYLGYLLDVNAFDQPAVEIYKKNTRKIIKSS